MTLPDSFHNCRPYERAYVTGNIARSSWYNNVLRQQTNKKKESQL